MLTPEIRKSLESAGINVSALERIKFAPGVVGKTTYVAVAAAIGLGLVAVRLSDSTSLLADAGLIILLFLGYFVGVLWFANKHPGVALLEGSHLLRWQQVEMAAKGIAQPPADSPIEEPNSSPLIAPHADMPDEP